LAADADAEAGADEVAAGEDAAGAEGDWEPVAVFFAHDNNENAKMNTNKIAKALFIVYPPLFILPIFRHGLLEICLVLSNVTKNNVVLTDVISITALKFQMSLSSV
jgi:hypothetical protein